MKVLAINGSPRPKGNTAQLIEMFFEAVRKYNDKIETEMIQIADKTINTCLSCYKCMKNRDSKCGQNDDLNDIYAKMVQADAIILGSPVYFGDVTGKMRCLIERTGFVAMANNGAFKRKIGAAIIAKRRQGGSQSWNTMNFLFGVSQMIIVGSNELNIGIGLAPGEIQNDPEAKITMKVLAKNIVWLLNKIHN